MKIVILLLLSLQSFANIKTNIISIESGKNPNTFDVLVDWNGRVFEVEKSQTRILDLLEEAQFANREVILEVERGAQFDLLGLKERIIDVRVLSLSKNDNNDEGTQRGAHPMVDYEATDLDSMETATKVFNGLETKTRRFSQCFNRAHIWSKSMWDNHRIKSMKIFIFYTKKFRTEVSDKWWYHVAPMVSVGGKKIVMDREFTKVPKTATDWEKIFTGKMNAPGYRCAKMENISSYFDAYNDDREFCHIQYASMYHWGPNDLKTAANSGVIQTDWKNWKLRTASKQAFKRWRKIYEEVKVK